MLLSSMHNLITVSLSELPECHVEIASNHDALHQLTCISLTPSVRILSPQLVATLFLCVAYTPETHQHIARPTYIRRLLEAYKIPRVPSAGDDLDEAALMLRYAMINSISLSPVLSVFMPR